MTSLRHWGCRHGGVEGGYRLDIHSRKTVEQALGGRALIRPAAPLACVVAGLALLVGCVDGQIDDLGDAQDVRDSSPARIPTSTIDLQVEFVNDRLSLRAQDVALKALLREIARQSSLVLVLHEPLDEPITLELHRLPLPEAMGRILRRQSFALHYIQPSSSAGNSDPARPSTLWVFAKGSEDDSNYDNDTEHSTPLDTAAIGGRNADELTAPLSLALEDEDARARAQAVSALADIGGDGAVAAMAQAMGDGDPAVRQEAVYALGDMGDLGDETAIQVLEQALMDPEENVREAAIEGFTDIGGDESARALAVTLNDEDASLGEEAVYALGEIGGETAIQLLQQTMATHASASIREAAAEILAELSGHQQ
jgi:hypothetical protein